MNRYLLIDHTLPQKHIANMLGRVVVEKTDPLRNFVPDADGQDAGFHPQHIVSDISDDPVQYDNLSRIIETAQNDQAKIRLSELRSLWNTGETVSSTLGSLSHHTIEVYNHDFPLQSVLHLFPTQSPERDQGGDAQRATGQRTS